jgi:hypothetical protein
VRRTLYILAFLVVVACVLWAGTYSQAVSVDANDGIEVGGTWYPQYLSMGMFDASSVIVTALRFTDVTVPKDSTISSATITLQASELVGTITNVHVVWFGEASDNPAVFGSGRLPSAVSATTASATWNPSAWTTDTTYSLTVTTIVQELVNRDGWTSGNAMAFTGNGNTSSSTSYASAYESSGGGVHTFATLAITYVDAAGRRKNVQVRIE